ncbi:outer membrane beta-barrel protein [Adhaeribacter sp. BT258]|uniref:Outer membrane beta-barrel protein n=1 Tax=Adhaeribacter terrigena TaxID=2793070 RepID=A0ABS1C1E9_9BACT|nr:outer membrane beta-barrel protein [Adhaeribacter terrigena]MBK0403226.1 outer membrane beta-barrel protein [Adhaeribacter terrigena]
MKLKSLLIGTLLSLDFLSASAQSGPYIGFISGINSTWVLDQKLFDDPNYEYNRTWNWAPYGVALGYKFNPISSVQVEFFKKNMGAEFDIIGRKPNVNQEETVGKKEIKLEYWSLPILYKYTTGGTVRFNMHLGPQFSFLSKGSEVNKMNETAELHVGPGTDLHTDLSVPTLTYPAGTYTLATKEDFKKTDFGLAFGFGMEADITNSLFFSANIRFYSGFKDIRSDEAIAEAKNWNYYDDSRNNITGGLQLGIHYRFEQE